MSQGCRRPAPPKMVTLAAGRICLLILAAAQQVQAAQPVTVVEASDLTQLSLNELLNIEVTSVSKRAEPLSDSAAAVFVLSGEEIRRSGVRSIAEALRLVPGMNVAQVSAHQYAISARGFNGTSADKLQVLLDGRSVYSPLFSGVFWDVLDTFVADIDRIEVIRGPGAALWGANAVNGVINILTKSARDTPGIAARLGGGNVEDVYAAARSGFRVGDGAMRIYAQGTAIDQSRRAGGGEATDGIYREQAGLRLDLPLKDSQNLTLSADTYTGHERAARIGGEGTADTDVRGSDLLARWSGRTSSGSDWSLQAYYDGYRREIPDVYDEKRHTADIDFQQSFSIGENQVLLYGANYRASRDETAGPPSAIVFSPAKRTLRSGGAFVQDQISLSPTVELTLGSKFESGNYSSFEFEPSLRIGWRAMDELYTWAAISRAVRTPNRLDQDVAIFCPPPDGIPGACGPGLFRVGNPDLESAKLVAYEWGLRFWPRSDFSLDLATFYNDYTELRSTEPTPPFGSFANNIDAYAYGGELSLVWNPAPWVTLRPYYQYLNLEAYTKSGSTDVRTVPALEGSDPEHQFGLRLSLQPVQRLQADADLRYVDRLPATDVPAYAEMNLRLAYLIRPNLELALNGKNLLDSHHPEWGAAASRFELRRGVMLELSWGLR